MPHDAVVGCWLLVVAIDGGPSARPRTLGDRVADEQRAEAVGEGGVARNARASGEDVGVDVAEEGAEGVAAAVPAKGAAAPAKGAAAPAAAKGAAPAPGGKAPAK